MESPFTDVHVLWITAGLGCDGDSVAVTAATQPSIEDVVQGIIPGIPTVHLHNPLLATENGEAFSHVRARPRAIALLHRRHDGSRDSRGPRAVPRRRDERLHDQPLNRADLARILARWAI